MTDLIKITKGPDAWYVTSERHVELFGTATIPTPFLPSADMNLVYREIAKRNPGTKIVVVPS